MTGFCKQHGFYAMDCPHCEDKWEATRSAQPEPAAPESVSQQYLRELVHEKMQPFYDAFNRHSNTPPTIKTEAKGWPVTPMSYAHPPHPDAEPRADGMPSSADERHLRRLLAVRIGMPQAYYDDGEAQGTEHGIQIDFMREPVADIDAKLRALNVARYETHPPRTALTDEQIYGLFERTGLSKYHVRDSQVSVEYDRLILSFARAVITASEGAAQ